MTDDREQLSGEKQAVVLALVDQRTVAAASRATGTARSTIYSWIQNDPLFRHEVARARAEVFAAGLDQINAAFEKSVRKLEDALEHGSARIRLQAALGLARLGMEMRAGHAVEEEMRTVARLRLAALQAEAKQYDEALQTLSAATTPGFEGLVQDRRGDILLAQGKTDEARTAYQAAYQAIGERVDYRRLVEAKLTALGAAPAASAAGAGR